MLKTHKTIYKQKEKLFTETACNSLVSALRPDTCFRAFQVAEFYWWSGEKNGTVILNK